MRSVCTLPALAKLQLARLPEVSAHGLCCVRALPQLRELQLRSVAAVDDDVMQAVLRCLLSPVLHCAALHCRMHCAAPCGAPAISPPVAGTALVGVQVCALTQLQRLSVDTALVSDAALGSLSPMMFCVTSR